MGSLSELLSSVRRLTRGLETNFVGLVDGLIVFRTFQRKRSSSILFEGEKIACSDGDGYIRLGGLWLISEDFMALYRPYVEILLYVNTIEDGYIFRTSLFGFQNDCKMFDKCPDSKKEVFDLSFVQRNSLSILSREGDGSVALLGSEFERTLSRSMLLADSSCGPRVPRGTVCAYNDHRELVSVLHKVLVEGLILAMGQGLEMYCMSDLYPVLNVFRMVSVFNLYATKYLLRLIYDANQIGRMVLVVEIVIEDGMHEYVVLVGYFLRNVSAAVNHGFVSREPGLQVDRQVSITLKAWLSWNAGDSDVAVAATFEWWNVLKAIWVFYPLEWVVETMMQISVSNETVCKLMQVLSMLLVLFGILLSPNCFYVWGTGLIRKTIAKYTLLMLAGRSLMLVIFVPLPGVCWRGK